jgi:hypothetical protein
MGRGDGVRRRIAALATVALTAILLAGAAITWYADAVLVDDQELSARMVSSLDDPDVRRVLADQVVSGLARDAIPDALVVRPLLVPAIAALADSGAFRRVLGRTIAARHRALVNGDTTFSLELPLGEGVVFEAVRRVAPRVARAIPQDLSVPVVRLDPREAELRGARILVDVAGWRWPLLAASLLAAIACAVLGGGVRGAVVNVGAAVAGGGLLVAAVVAGVGEFVVAHAAHAAGLSSDEDRGAIHTVWSAIFGDLRSAALTAALGGALVAAIASIALPSVDPGAGWRWAQAVVRSRGRAARTARAVLLVLAGALVLFAPALFGRVAIAVAGVLVVLFGLAQLSGPAPERDERVVAARAGSRRRANALAPAGAVALVVIATLLAIVLVLPGPRATPLAIAGPADGCNGSRALCDRRLDDVVFAATHNSYSAADEPGWLFANQRRGIARQLRDGIRALLIDIHLGAPDPESGRIRTDLAAEGSDRNKVRRQLSPAALRAADRLVGRAGVGKPVGRRRPYLCHTLCELGAEPLDEQLEIIRRFLTANRREVVLLFIEPYVGVDVIEKALRDADLLREAPALQPGDPLPTLGELVRADTRLVVLAEQDGGTRPWYLDGFSFVQDTPLGATRPGQLSCERYRGDADSPLFMINHWIPPFPPSVTRNRAIGGAYLRARLGRCERARDLLPNIVAVDFYERTGVVDAARRLNEAQPEVG